MHTYHVRHQAIERSIRLRPRRLCEQEHVRLSHAFLHNSAVRARQAYANACRTLFVGPSLRCDWSMGRSLMDRSIEYLLVKLKLNLKTSSDSL